MITILAKKGMELDERHLMFADHEDVRAVLAQNAVQRLESRTWNRGYSKNRNNRALANIPISVYQAPNLRHIFNNPDIVEGAKNRRKFLRDNPKFLVVDKQ